MTEINHILVPTDGSEGAQKAAAFAGDLARACNAKVSLLYVQSDELVSWSAWGAGGYPAEMPPASMSVDEIRNDLEQRYREKELPETAIALGEVGEDPELAIIWGYPADEICRFAKERNVDLIVIGSHGRTGLKRALLGSVSHAVANQAHCPVTIVR